MCEARSSEVADVTEQEWVDCGDVEKMLQLLRDSGHVGGRKMRLFACACARRVWRLLDDDRSRRGGDVAERWADRQTRVGEALVAGYRGIVTPSPPFLRCPRLGSAGPCGRPRAPWPGR